MDHPGKSSSQISLGLSIKPVAHMGTFLSDTTWIPVDQAVGWPGPATLLQPLLHLTSILFHPTPTPPSPRAWSSTLPPPYTSPPSPPPHPSKFSFLPHSPVFNAPHHSPAFSILLHSPFLLHPSLIWLDRPSSPSSFSSCACILSPPPPPTTSPLPPTPPLPLLVKDSEL